MRDVAAREADFHGVTFRSRTEARWAVSFNALDMDYAYEPERLNLSSGESYLPDFLLPDLQAYFEVKPGSDAIVTVECVRARTLASDLRNRRVWLAPEPRMKTARTSSCSTSGLSTPELKRS